MRAEDIASLDGESGIIATLIHHPEFIFYSEHLLPNHFTDKDNRIVYAAITQLVHNDIKTIDPYNIMEVLNAREATRKLAGELSVERLQEFMEMSDVLARNSVEEYRLLVSSVLDAASRRDAFQKLKECQALCYDRTQENIQEQIYLVIDDVMTEFSIDDDIPGFSEIADDLWADIVAHQDGHESGAPFKFPTLNEYVTIEPG